MPIVAATRPDLLTFSPVGHDSAISAVLDNSPVIATFVAAPSHWTTPARTYNVSPQAAVEHVDSLDGDPLVDLGVGTVYPHVTLLSRATNTDIRKINLANKGPERT